MANSIFTRPLEPIPEHSSPMAFDAYHMGTQMGRNVMVMQENHASERCNYLIIVNIKTGERLLVSFDQDNGPSSASLIVNSIHSH